MPPDRRETTPAIASYPAVRDHLVSLGFSRQRAESILAAAQTDSAQELEHRREARLLRITYLALGRFSLEIHSYPARPPAAGRPGQAETQMHRRTVKIRRTGRHTSPSQVEKIAVQAGKAAPAMAIAGALVAAPHAQSAAKIPAKPAAAAERVHTNAKVTRAAQAGRGYAVVRQGDTLAAIAQRLYGNPAAWTRLYQANRPEINDPNLIYPGEKLQIPDGPAGHVSAPGHARASHLTSSITQSENENDGGGQSEGGDDAAQSAPGHARTSDPTASAAQSENENDGGGQSEGGDDAGQPAPAAQSEGEDNAAQSAPAAQSASSTALSGTLSCSGLEQLWQQAGGSPAAAVTAASVAMAESSGQQDTTGPVGERGYWQIAPFNAGSSYDPMTNARAAVAISSDGTNWTPWTTYNNGAYAGRC